MYFKRIGKTEHHIKNHEKYFPWSKVIEIILTAKNKRKKGDKIQIKTKDHYLLCKLKDRTLWVINAKYLK